MSHSILVLLLAADGLTREKRFIEVEISRKSELCKQNLQHQLSGSRIISAIGNSDFPDEAHQNCFS